MPVLRGIVVERSEPSSAPGAVRDVAPFNGETAMPAATVALGDGAAGERATGVATTSVTGAGGSTGLGAKTTEFAAAAGSRVAPAGVPDRASTIPGAADEAAASTAAPSAALRAEYCHPTKARATTPMPAPATAASQAFDRVGGVLGTVAARGVGADTAAGR